jgi:hypothetical protein
MKGIFMRRVLMTALAVASMAVATPAFATATLHDQNGPDLNTKIYASHDDPSVAPNVGSSTNNWTVYGNTSTGAGHNVSFQGFSSYDPTANSGAGSGTGTSISITDGGGFAQVFDTDYVAPTGQNPNPTQDNVMAIIMDPTPAFTAYEFSIQLALQGNDTANMWVYYMLTGGSTWIQASNTPLLTGGNDNQFILNGLDPGQSFDKILITSAAPIFQVKQNSIDIVGGVPEPASWALMLLGFGGIGMTMRFRRRQDGRLAQIA